MNKKGNLVLYFAFIATAVIVILVASVLAPMGILFTEKMYEAGEGILENSQASLDAINDTAIKTSINNSINSAKAATDMNIEVNSDIFQYSWILVIFIGALMVFLYARSLVEFGQGGFI